MRLWWLLALVGAALSAPTTGEQNVLSMQKLAWSHGPGWSLYACLVARTVGVEVPTEGDAFVGTPEFSQALQRWQTEHQLAATGIADAATLMKLKNDWQDHRPFRLGLAPEEDLVVIPLEESTQGNELKVGRRTYDAYHRMRAAALADGVPKEFLTVISAYRSAEYQKKLLKSHPRANGNQLGKKSTHSNGRALDLHVGGELVSTKNSNRALQVHHPAYRWLIRNARKFGFTPYFFEPWHWEFNG